MNRGGFLEEVVEHVLLQPRREILWHVAAVVEVGKGLVALYRHAPTSISAGHIGRKIRIEELSTERGSVRDVRGGAGANCENSVGAPPVERKFGLEDLRVRVSFHALTDGGSCICTPTPSRQR